MTQQNLSGTLSCNPALDSEHRWEARAQEDPAVQTQDTGPLHTPILIPLFDQLRHSVDAWHTQRGLRALIGQPPAVILQLDRFRVHAGQVVKTDTPVTLAPGSSVLMPAFAGPALDLTYHIYEVTAAIIHRGPSPTAGHYGTALFASESTWLADDGAQPQLSPNIPDLSKNCYLIFLKKSH